jgi:hypothetical protein
MADNLFRKKPGPGRPKIWASGGQRPPFDLRALGRAALLLSREAVAPLHAWAAKTVRRVAVNIRNGAGRIPEAKLGRAAPYVPSHLRVAAWIKNLAVTLAHASASADPDVKRGNALVAGIEPHLWSEPSPAPSVPEPEPSAADAPVVLAEPVETAAAEAVEEDPLAWIRGDLAGRPGTRHTTAPRVTGPDVPPAPPGQAAVMAMQVIGYGIGWGTSFVALPYGLIRALWLYAKGVDLRKLGVEE